MCRERCVERERERMDKCAEMDVGEKMIRDEQTANIEIVS